MSWSPVGIAAISGRGRRSRLANTGEGPKRPLPLGGTANSAVLSGLSASDPHQRLSESDSSETRNLYLNTRDSSPLHDVRVRQAVAWLINRDKLASTVYDDTVDPLYSLIPTGITGHTTSFFDAYPTQSGATAKDMRKTIMTVPKMAGKMPPSVLDSRGSALPNSQTREA